MAPFLWCAENPLNGAQSNALLVATVPGRDSGAGVLANMINSISGHHVRGFAASAGYVHLAEFSHRWLNMREKMTDPNNPDYAYFSQFRLQPRDGFASSNPDSDFRSMQELIRRRIKPAWFHFYNLTNVLCGVRSLLIDAIQPPKAGNAFGFMHAFSLHEEAVGESMGKLSQRSEDASMIMKSLDLFLMLFPKGRVIVHLPFTELPRPEYGRPRCVCPATARCLPLPEGDTWPDERVQVMQQLLRFHHERPERTLLTVAVRDFGNLSSLADRLVDFLEVPTSTVPISDAEDQGNAVAGSSKGKKHGAGLPPRAAIKRAGARSLQGWSARLRREKVLSLQKGPTALQASNAAASGERQRLGRQFGCRVEKKVPLAGLFVCPETRCEGSLATDSSTSQSSKKRACTTCPTTLADWGWRSWSQPEDAEAF